MNRDELAASARCAVTLVAGAALFVALGWITRWWIAVAVLVALSGAAAAWIASLPRRWMPW